jgi:hypothetical protein
MTFGCSRRPGESSRSLTPEQAQAFVKACRPAGPGRGSCVPYRYRRGPPGAWRTRISAFFFRGGSVSFTTLCGTRNHFSAWLNADPNTADVQNRPGRKPFLEFGRDQLLLKDLGREPVEGTGREPLAKFLARWLEDCVHPRSRARTFGLYKQQVEAHIIPAIGDIALAIPPPAFRHCSCLFTPGSWFACAPNSSHAESGTTGGGLALAENRIRVHVNDRHTAR